MPPSKIYKYFVEQFGEIAMPSFIPGFAFIVFRYYDKVVKVLAEPRIEIEGHNILAKRADHRNLPYKMYEHVRQYATDPPMTPFEVDQLLLQPEDEASPQNIVNVLNEDCVCKILVRLSLLDLCNIAKTCKQLNAIAKTVFERKYKKKTIDLSDLKQNGETMVHIRYYLNNFGSSVTSIDLYEKIEDGANSDVVELLDNQCKNLESLSLDGCLMEHFVIDNYMVMFGRLKKLCVRPGLLPLNRLLAACSQLERLNVYLDINSDLKDVSLPNLVALTVQAFNCWCLEEFLMRHPHIETFEFVMSPTNPDLHHYYTNQLIYDHLPNIREINLYSDETPPFSEMKNLKSVEFTFINSKTVATSINELLEQFTPVEELLLDSGTIDDNAIESVCKIQTIKEIWFIDCSGLDKKKIYSLG